MELYGTEIVEIWSSLIEQLAGNVILFRMSKGVGAQNTILTMAFGCLVGFVSCATIPLLIPNSITFPASCLMSLDHISTISKPMVEAACIANIPSSPL